MPELSSLGYVITAQDREILGADGTAADVLAGNILLYPGDASGAGGDNNGGMLDLTAGDSVNGAGGVVNIVAGQSDAGAGGNVSITAGLSAAGNAGNATLQGGNSTDGDAGAAYMRGGTSDNGLGGSIVLIAGSGGAGQGAIYLPNLPTADPHDPDALWNNSGVLTISAG